MGTTGSIFLTASPSSGAIPPGGEVSVSVTADSTGFLAGEFPGSVVVTSNDPDEPELLLPVTLTVNAEIVLEVSPQAISFPDTFVGLTSNQVVEVSNEGNAPLIIAGIETDFPTFIDAVLPLEIAPFSSTSFNVRWEPTATGTFSGSLDLISNDSDEATISIPLSGTVPESPEANLGASLVSFEANVGEVQSRSFTLSNTGPTSLEFQYEPTLSALTNPLENVLVSLDANSDAIASLLPNPLNLQRWNHRQ